MKTTTAYNHFSRLKAQLDNTFSAAECYFPKHGHLLDQVIQILKSVPAKCPKWVNQTLSNHADARWERIQREFVLWLHPTASGFKTWDLLTDQERAECAKPEYRGNFVWLRETTGRGTIADKNTYKEGETITRSFVITGKIYS